MRHASNVKYDDFDDTYPAVPGRMAQLEKNLLEAEPGSAHARHLQQLLLQAYTETKAEEKLPRSQRLAIILGTTTGLWMLIAVGAIAIF